MLQGEPFDDVTDHAHLLLDATRIERFGAALTAMVRPGDVVADLGSGSGILALLAARAGARKVYAVERNAAIADLVARHIVENDLQGTVELIRGDIHTARFAEPPSLVITETLGNFGIEEDILALTAAVKAQCAPGVRFIPSGLEIVLAPLHDETLARNLAGLSRVAGVSMGALRTALTRRALLHRIMPEDLAGPPTGAGWLAVPGAPLPERHRATLTIDRDRPLNAIGGWFRCTLAPGIDLDTGPESPPTSWQNLVFPLDPPLAARIDDRVEVEIRPRELLRYRTWSWDARLQPR